MFELAAKVNELEDNQLSDIEMQSKQVLILQSVKRHMEDIITKLAETPPHLSAFTYYLR